MRIAIILLLIMILISIIILIIINEITNVEALKKKQSVYQALVRENKNKVIIQYLEIKFKKSTEQIMKELTNPFWNEVKQEYYSYGILENEEE